MPTAIDWNQALLEQLTFHWDGRLRPRLDGLTDEEYFWEPADGSWSLRPEGESTAAITAGGGRLKADFAVPEPEPAPLTTIAWRFAHVLVGVLGERNASHFGAAPADYLTFDYPETAADAVARLDDAYRTWVDGVRGLGAEGLARAVGPAEGVWAEAPYATLVLHIHRELIHHGSEISLLRDLYAHRPLRP